MLLNTTHRNFTCTEEKNHCFYYKIHALYKICTTNGQSSVQFSDGVEILSFNNFYYWGNLDGH